MRRAVLGLLAARLLTAASDIEAARDRQDLTALETQAARLSQAAAAAPADARTHYRAALVRSYQAEVSLERGDKGAAQRSAEAGIKAAQRAVELQPGVAEYHRILGTLCGQVIPANVLLGLKYGRCAMDEVKRALELNPKFAAAYVSQGVGNYYLPASFGGGVEPALRDFRKALELDPQSDEAHLWLGVALRKAGRNAEARAALRQSLRLNPDRLWAKQQLEKTPEK